MGRTDADTILYSKKILPYIEPRQTKICEFEEGEGAFVGEFEGGQAKL